MIHLVGLPHTSFDKHRFSSCAFTAKAVRLVEMLRSVGREVTVYWGGIDGDVVSCLEPNDQFRYFDEYSPNELPVIKWDPKLPYWKKFHKRAVEQIGEVEPTDIVALVGGSVSQEIANHYSGRCTVIEPGVGYEGLTKGPVFACFESYAWMHHLYGMWGITDGRAFDAVIPNAVDPADWSVADSDGYALWVGRLINRKGPHVAADIAKRAGLQLIMAGGGVASTEPGRIVATDGTVVEGDHVTHIGSVSGEDRRWLFAHAEVFICPTLYIGPWEGVHAEAMMSGVPVVAPDYGVFTETLPEQFRYRNLAQAHAAVHAARVTRGDVWRQRAIDRFSIKRCAAMYNVWFDRLDSLRDGRNGWYG